MNPIRRTAAGAVAAAAALALAACGLAQPTASTELSDKPVTLRVMWWGGEARHERTQEVVTLFEERYPNITIEPEFSDWSEYWEKLATATAEGSPPDVVQMDQLYLASYASRGRLADLGPLTQLRTSGVDHQSVLGMGTWNDTLYAMPISTTSTGLLVNMDLIGELGTPLPDTSTWSWEEFGAWAQEVTEKSPAGTYGTGIIHNEFSLQLFARQHGDELFSEDGIVIEPETLADYFRLALDWTSSGAAAPAALTAESLGLPLDQTPFATGKTAAIFAPSTLITAYAAAIDAELELVPLPTPDAGATKYDYFKPGMYWSVSSTSEHPAEAALLIDYLVNDPEATAIIGTERGIPANARTLDNISEKLTPEEAKAADFAQQRTAHVGEAPTIVPNGASDIESILQRYIQDVIFERQKPLDAANGLIAEVRSSIDAAV